MKIDSNILNLKLKASNGKEYSLSDIHAKYILIYFYPADNTPLCTIQGAKYTEYFDEYKKLDCTVLGISAGSGQSKCDFASSQKYKQLLLSDKDYLISKAFGVYTEEGLPQYPDLKIFRCSFILNNNKEIIRERRYVDYKEDAHKNLEYLKSIE